MYSTHTTSISTQLKLTYRTHSNTPAYHFTSHRNQYLALTLREQDGWGKCVYMWNRVLFSDTQ